MIKKIIGAASVPVFFRYDLESYQANLPARLISTLNQVQKSGGTPFEYERETESSLGVSSIFRRGASIASTENFQDIVDVLTEYFADHTSPVDIFIIGVAQFQEPISLLAVINTIHPELTLEEKVAMRYCDLDPHPIINKTFFGEPAYAPESFIKDGRKFYPIKEITDFLEKTKNSQSLFGSYIQGIIPNIPEHSTDIISYNNVSQYLEKDEAIQVMGHIYRILSPGGILITNPEDKSPLQLGMEEVKPGIYKK